MRSLARAAASRDSARLEQMHQERESASAGRGDYLAAVGIDNCERPVLGHSFHTLQSGARGA